MILSFLLIITVISSSAIKASAATGYEGYALFRDGAFYTYEWHAGLMDDPYSSSTGYPVLHAPGYGYTLQWDTLDKFIKGQNFKGVYQPIGGISSSGRDNVKALSRKLMTENIPYNVSTQLEYDQYTGGKTVWPEDIYAIRCDGLVEYCYEFHFYRIIGNDNYWDIATRGYENYNQHGGLLIATPRIQASNMSLVTTSKP